MPRRLKVKTQEMGDLELYLIYQYGDAWEKEWVPLQGHPLTDLLSSASKEDLDAALIGLSWPLTSKLGIPPAGALIKMPSKQCYRRKLCPFFDKKACQPTSKNLPTCFEIEGTEDVEVRRLGAEIVKLWRESVYVVVVQERSQDG